MTIALIPAPDGTLVPQYVELALDEATWDIATPFRWLLGAEAIVQRIRVRLRFWKGEWFLDQRLGTPYLERILAQKEEQIPDIDAIFSKVVRTTPGVLSVAFFRSEFDRPTRTLTSSFDARMRGGSLLAVRKEPFII
jgi:hypothetical protein